MIIVLDSGLIHDVVEVREARAVEVHGAGDDEPHAPGQHHQDVDGGHLPVLYVLKMTTIFFTFTIRIIIYYKLYARH